MRMTKTLQVSDKLGMSKHLEREADRKNVQDKDTLRMNKNLPLYFHNIGTRMGVTHAHGKTLRDNHITETKYMNDSTLNTTKKEFRIDPNTA